MWPFFNIFQGLSFDSSPLVLESISDEFLSCPVVMELLRWNSVHLIGHLYPLGFSVLGFLEIPDRYRFCIVESSPRRISNNCSFKYKVHYNLSDMRPSQKLAFLQHSSSAVWIDWRYTFVRIFRFVFWQISVTIRFHMRGISIMPCVHGIGSCMLDEFSWSTVNLDDHHFPLGFNVLVVLGIPRRCLPRRRGFCTICFKG